MRKIKYLYNASRADVVDLKNFQIFNLKNVFTLYNNINKKIDAIITVY